MGQLMGGGGIRREALTDFQSLTSFFGMVTLSLATQTAANSRKSGVGCKGGNQKNNPHANQPPSPHLNGVEPPLELNGDLPLPAGQPEIPGTVKGM